MALYGNGNAMTTSLPRRRTVGGGEIDIEAFQRSSSIATLSSTYPLRLISHPVRTSSQAAIIFMSSYGGGLVAGDHVDMHVRVRPKARLALLTQGSTKIYKTPSKDFCTEQNLTATIDEGAALLLLPDPIQPFKASSYKQSQTFHVHPQHSSVAFLDWLSAGRAARGEAWEFFQWRGRNEVWCTLPANAAHAAPKRLLLRDNVILDGMSPLEQSYRDEMDDLGVFGTLILRGPVFHPLAEFFLREFTSLPRVGGASRKTPSTTQAKTATLAASSRLTWTAASTRGCVIIKFGAKDTDEAKQWLREMLEREGTVEREFGRHSLLCLQ